MNQIKAGAVLNYVIIGLNALVGLLYTPFMLRCLGQNEYGLYSLVASIIAYLTLLDFGFGPAVVRYTAKYRAERKTKEQYSLFGLFFTLYSIIGVIAFVIGLLLYFNIDWLFDKTMSQSDLSQALTSVIIEFEHNISKKHPHRKTENLTYECPSETVKTELYIQFLSAINKVCSKQQHIEYSLNDNKGNCLIAQSENSNHHSCREYNSQNKH